MEFLNEFGFDPMLFFAQVVNFLIIFYILKRFMYKPVLEMLKKRENEIKKGISNKEESDRLLAETREKETQILQKAQIKAENIVNNAKEEANQIKIQNEENTKREAKKMITEAKITIENETKEAEEKLTAKIGNIAIMLLEKSLTGIFGKKEQEIILKKAAAQLQKDL